MSLICRIRSPSRSAGRPRERHVHFLHPEVQPLHEGPVTEHQNRSRHQRSAGRFQRAPTAWIDRQAELPADPLPDCMDGDGHTGYREIYEGRGAHKRRHPGRQRQGRDHFRVGDGEPYREHQVQQENGRARGTQPRTGKPLTGCPQQQRRDAPLNEDSGSGNKEIERINHAGNPVLLSHYCIQAFTRMATAAAAAVSARRICVERDTGCQPAAEAALPLGVRPAALRSDQQRRGCIRRADLRQHPPQGRGRGFFQEIAELRAFSEALGEAHRRADLGRLQPPGLLAALSGHPVPSLGALARGFVETSFRRAPPPPERCAPLPARWPSRRSTRSGRT